MSDRLQCQFKEGEETCAADAHIRGLCRKHYRLLYQRGKGALDAIALPPRPRAGPSTPVDPVTAAIDGLKRRMNAVSEYETVRSELQRARAAVATLDARLTELERFIVAGEAPADIPARVEPSPARATSAPGNETDVV